MTHSKSFFPTVAVTFLLLFLCACSHQSAEDQFVEHLLSQMTLDEKIGQMNQLDGPWQSETFYQDLRDGKIGSVFSVVTAEEADRIQHMVVDSSRLGIPVLFARDVIHGFHLVYPIPLGQSTTWNPDLAEEAARLTAIEAKLGGVRWTFSPMVDVARDPRWGRIAEGYGEDTYLTGLFGAATVRGYQKEGVAACVKHFAGYSVTEGGRDYNTTWIPEVQLRDTYLPPFKACADAGALSFMCSFNDINGVPSAANQHLNIDILRNEWGYDGLLVSDWGASHDMIAHGYAADNVEATVQSIDARIEMDMAGFCYRKELKALIEQGRVRESQIDDCVRSILRMKYRLGLFEHPFVDQSVSFPVEEARAAAQRTCEESAVLLKNNGVLPLDASKLYICGPMANNQHDQNGTWCFDAVDSLVITPLQAFRAAKNAVNYQSGFHWSREVLSKTDIETLVAGAKQADVILYFAGEEAMISGEAKTRAHLDLPGNQTEQLRALKATGKKLVLVVMAGRPLCIGEEVAMADAVLYAYHGGTMQGPALYNLLTGIVNPSGHLTTTFPQAVGQIPFYYNHKNTGRPTWGAKDFDFWSIPVNAGQFSLGSSTYWMEYGMVPLFYFGYGLSYTTFEYGAVCLSDTLMARGGNLQASCVVKNTGSRAGYAVPQFYLRDMVGSICRPLIELKGFRKVWLEPGEEQTVTFDISEETLAYWHFAPSVKPGADGAYEYAAEPGAFRVWIAPDAAFNPTLPAPEFVLQ